MYSVGRTLFGWRSQQRCRLELPKRWRRDMHCAQKVFDAGQPTHSSHPEVKLLFTEFNKENVWLGCLSLRSSPLLEKGEITPGITELEYISRRKKLLEMLPEGSLAILASAPVKMMTDVVPYPFRQEADYLYITGCQQPGGVAVLSKDFGLWMFMPDPSPQEVIWQGQVAGVDAAVDIFKAEKAFPIGKMHEILPDMVDKTSMLFLNAGTSLPNCLNFDALGKASRDRRIKDLGRYAHEMRWIKSPSELKLMKESASIACQAILQTMLFSKSYPHEGILSAKVEYECKLRGAQRMAFNPVVGGGESGSIIHYSRNDKKIGDGDFVLMDVGCEFHGYLSDITRTWPPCGSFSPSQEILYELILETSKECIKLCKPGISIQEIHNYSVQMLQKGLKELGILKDRPSLSTSYNQLNPTSIGHYLGMDIHDCSVISNSRPLQPGVVITIEPGIYIPSTLDVPERFQGIGIRIEDEVLITETGHEVLTGSLPKEIQQIRSLLNHGQQLRYGSP